MGKGHVEKQKKRGRKKKMGMGSLLAERTQVGIVLVEKGRGPTKVPERNLKRWDG